jgi:hypothetical protein
MRLAKYYIGISLDGNHKKKTHSQCAGQDLKSVPAEYKSRALLTRLFSLLLLLLMMISYSPEQCNL